MTPERRLLVVDLIDHRITADELLERWGPDDREQIGLQMLRTAIELRDPAQLEAAISISSTFGFTDAHAPVMVEAFVAEWHRSHEDLVETLARRGDPELVDVMLRAATWVPEHLAWDDARAMATKAIYGLGRTDDGRAKAALWQLVDDPADPVRECAAYQLGLRSSPWSGDPDDVGDYADVTRPSG